MLYRPCYLWQTTRRYRWFESVNGWLGCGRRMSIWWTLYRCIDESSTILWTGDCDELVEESLGLLVWSIDWLGGGWYYLSLYSTTSTTHCCTQRFSLTWNGRKRCPATKSLEPPACPMILLTIPQCFPYPSPLITPQQSFIFTRKKRKDINLSFCSSVFLLFLSWLINIYSLFFGVFSLANTKQQFHHFRTLCCARISRRLVLFFLPLWQSSK